MSVHDWTLESTAMQRNFVETDDCDGSLFVGIIEEFAARMVEAICRGSGTLRVDVPDSAVLT